MKLIREETAMGVGFRAAFQSRHAPALLLQQPLNAWAEAQMDDAWVRAQEERLSRMLDEAFAEGKASAQRSVREALGVT